MTKQSNKPSFEESLAQLDALMRELENSDTGLDRSLELYEKGVSLLKQCRSILDQAERRIRIVTGIDENGNPIEDDFDATATTERDETSGRSTQTGQTSQSSTEDEQAPRTRRKKTQSSANNDEADSDPGDLLF